MNIRGAITELSSLVTDDLQEQLDYAIRLCVEALATGHRVLACGNGGSASQASHFVAELVGRFDGRWLWLPAISLNADTAVMTAMANDMGYHDVFVEQVRALGHEDDVLVALSTSGQSPNILRAMERAHLQNLSVILFTGENELQQPNYADVCLRVPSGNTQRIQEMHLVLLHQMAEGIVRGIYGGSSNR